MDIVKSIFDQVILEQLTAIVIGLTIMSVLLPLFYIVSKFDRDKTSHTTSIEKFENQSRSERFKGWLLWALPTAIIAIVIGANLAGIEGVIIGALYGLLNAAATSYTLRLESFGNKGRKTIITLCIFQLPIGILRFLIEGL